MRLRHLMESEGLPQKLIISNNGGACFLRHSFTHEGIHYAIYTYDHGLHIMGGFFPPSEGIGGRMVQDYSTFKVLDYTYITSDGYVDEFKQRILQNLSFQRIVMNIQVEVVE